MYGFRKGLRVNSGDITYRVIVVALNCIALEAAKLRLATNKFTRNLTSLRVYDCSSLRHLLHLTLSSDSAWASSSAVNASRIFQKAFVRRGSSTHVSRGCSFSSSISEIVDEIQESAVDGRSLFSVGGRMKRGVLHMSSSKSTKSAAKMALQ